MPNKMLYLTRSRAINMKKVAIFFIIFSLTSCATSWDRKYEVLRENAEKNYEKAHFVKQVNPEEICSGKEFLYLCSAYRKFGGEIYYYRWISLRSNVPGHMLMKNGKPIASEGKKCSWQWKEDKGYCYR